jgi:hypothetical protein
LEKLKHTSHKASKKANEAVYILLVFSEAVVVIFKRMLVNELRGGNVG